MGECFLMNNVFLRSSFRSIAPDATKISASNIDLRKTISVMASKAADAQSQTLGNN